MKPVPQVTKMIFLISYDAYDMSRPSPFRNDVSNWWEIKIISPLMARVSAVGTFISWGLFSLVTIQTFRQKSKIGHPVSIAEPVSAYWFIISDDVIHKLWIIIQNRGQSGDGREVGSKGRQGNRFYLYLLSVCSSMVWSMLQFRIPTTPTLETFQHSLREVAVDELGDPKLPYLISGLTSFQSPDMY